MKKNLSLVLAIVMLLGTIFSVIPMAEASSETTPAEPAVKYTPEVTYTNLNYSDKMYMMFAVPAPASLGEGEVVSLLLWGSREDGTAFSYKDQNKKVLTAEATPVKIGDVDHLVFKYDELTAADMTQIVCVRPVVLKTTTTTAEDGKTTTETKATAYGKLVEYSVLEYVAAAKGEFEGIAGLADQNVVTMLDSMLNFGALAQKYLSTKVPEFYANDELAKVWMIPVINGIVGEKVFVGFKPAGACDVTLTAPFIDGTELLGFTDAEGNAVVDSDGLYSNGTQVAAAAGDLTITAEYRYTIMWATDANSAIVETVNLIDNGTGNKFAAGQGGLAINCGAGKDAGYDYAGFDVIADPYEEGNKVFRVSGNTQYSLAMGDSTTDLKFTMKPSAIEGWGETMPALVTFEFTVARGANGQMPRTGNLRLRSNDKSYLTNVGYFEKGGTFMLYTSSDGSATTALPLKVSETGYTRYVFVVDFDNEVLYAFAADEGKDLVYQASTKTPFLSGGGKHVAGDPWMNWAQTLDRVEWMGGQAYNNFTAEEKATLKADLDGDGTPESAMVEGDIINAKAVQWCYRNYRAMLLKEWTTYVGAPVASFPETFDMYDVDANSAVNATTKNALDYINNFGDEELVSKLGLPAGSTFGGLGTNYQSVAVADYVNYAGLDIIDDPYKAGNKVYSFNGTDAGVIWQAQNIKNAGDKPAYTSSLKISSRAKGFFDGSIVPVITYDMVVGGNGSDRMLETDTIRFRGGSNTYVHLFKIAADGSILVCKPNETYTDAVFVDTGADVKKDGYTRIVASVDCGNEQFRLYAADEGAALKLIATIDTLWITSTNLSHSNASSAPKPKTFETWMDMAKTLDRTEIIIDDFGANALTAEELVTLTDAAKVQAFCRQSRALLIKDWDTYLGCAK